MQLAITGDEAIGHRYNFLVPASELPAVPFDYIMAGNGYGTVYLLNTNGSGTPSGSWNCEILADFNDGQGRIFRSVASTGNLASVFAPGGNLVNRPTSQIANRFIHYDPAIDTEGIEFDLALIATPSALTSATLTVVVQGMIVSFGNNNA